jgi:molybdopterin converting factor small subunit
VYALNVRIRLSGLLASSAGCKEMDKEIGDGTTAGELFIKLGIPVSGDWVRISVNGVLKDRKHVLKDGDEILYFPVGGGG